MCHGVPQETIGSRVEMQLANNLPCRRMGQLDDSALHKAHASHRHRPQCSLMAIHKEANFLVHIHALETGWHVSVTTTGSREVLTTLPTHVEQWFEERCCFRSRIVAGPREHPLGFRDIYRDEAVRNIRYQHHLFVVCIIQSRHDSSEHERRVPELVFT